MKKRTTKKADMRLEALIGQLVRIAMQLEKETGGYMTFEMRFGPKPAATKKVENHE
jgi:hypothetical protein